SYGPEAFEGRAEYIVFLLTTVPLDLILFTQVLLSFWLFSYDKRKWLYVEMLKKVLLTGIIIAVGSIPIDAMLWPENIFFDTYPAVFWLVWFLYFKKSARVRIVFKERHWDWNTFHKRSNVQQTGQSPE
ncbi:MAG: hypothetical protein NTW07_10405, partial [candidate division Zixibacteria bacterium]|nr:hypothetical protein [candidate division Zixibacteria bacterium]